MTIYGLISHHLIRARETALAHDSQSTIERVAIETVVAQIDLLIAAVRRMHHQVTLGHDKRPP